MKEKKWKKKKPRFCSCSLILFLIFSAPCWIPCSTFFWRKTETFFAIAETFSFRFLKINNDPGEILSWRRVFSLSSGSMKEEGKKKLEIFN